MRLTHCAKRALRLQEDFEDGFKDRIGTGIGLEDYLYGKPFLGYEFASGT